MAKCTFCGRSIPKGTGMTFVRKTGKILNFCSRKCEKNMLKLGRIPRKVTWTEAAMSQKKKRGSKND